MFKLLKIRKTKKRIGRGIGSRGAKSGRGMKGQKARAGAPRKRPGFEGGQTPLYMRLPKVSGAKQNFASQVNKPVAVSVQKLNQFEANTIVGPGQLRKIGLLKNRADKVKLVGKNDLDKKLTVRVHAISSGARDQVEKAGGKVEIIER